MSGKYTVISTFAGTGGSSLGYKWAGFKELLAIDFDPHAVECFRLNFPEVTMWHRDIKSVSAQEIFDFCKIKEWELDIFDGSPPCQGFSTAGKRQVSDDRNDLFKEYVRLIDGLKPKVFVMENVTGMIKGAMKGKFKEILGILKALPYQVKCKQMNAKYYGVPQSRERLIFIGVRNDLGIEPSYPVPGRKLIMVRDAFKDVPKEYADPIPNTEFGQYLIKTRPGENASKYHPKGSGFAHYRLHYDKPAQTIVKCPGYGKYPKVIHPVEDRGITVAEMKRLCSFPDEWIFSGDAKQAQQRLGNAVMPKFMQAIAENIKVNILDKYYGQMTENIA